MVTLLRRGGEGGLAVKLRHNYLQFPTRRRQWICMYVFVLKSETAKSPRISTLRKFVQDTKMETDQ